MNKGKYGKCASCWHYDSRNGYCPLHDIDVSRNCGCTDHESTGEHLEDNGR